MTSLLALSLPKPVPAVGMTSHMSLFIDNKDASIQGFLDNCKDKHFIGLEYIIEIDPVTSGEGLWYACKLCDITYKTQGALSPLDNIKQHLSWNSHKMKYLTKYFPKISAVKLKSPNTTVLNEIIKMVELRYGRLKAKLLLGKKLLNDKAEEIQQAIVEGDHFVENDEFFKMVTEENFDSKTNSVKNSKSSETDMPAAAPGKSLIDEDEKLSDISQADDDEFTSAKTNDPADHQSKKGLPSDRTSQVDDKKKQDFDDASSLSSFDDNQEQETAGKANNSEPAVNIKDSLKPEDRRAQIRKERFARVKSYRDEVQLMEEMMNKKRQEYLSDPTSHPSHGAECQKFTTIKINELQLKGLNEKGYDFQPEWKIKWTLFVENEHTDRIKEMNKNLMRKYKLLDRDLIEFDFQKSLHSARADRSPSPTSRMTGDPFNDIGDDYEVGFQSSNLRSASKPPALRYDLSDEYDGGFFGSQFDHKKSIKRKRDPYSSLSSEYSKRSNDRGEEWERHDERGHRGPSQGPVSDFIEKRGSERSSEKESRVGVSSKKHYSECINIFDPAILSTLRLISALEPSGVTKDFGLAVDYLLGKAITMENEVNGSSFSLVDDPQCHLTLQKIKSLVYDKIASESLSHAVTKACRVVVDNIAIILQQSNLHSEDVARYEQALLDESADNPFDASSRTESTASKNKSRKIGPSNRAGGENSFSKRELTVRLTIAKHIEKQLKSMGHLISHEELADLVDSEYERIKHYMISQSVQQVREPEKAANKELHVTAPKQIRKDFDNQGWEDQGPSCPTVIVNNDWRTQAATPQLPQSQPTSRSFYQNSPPPIEPQAGQSQAAGTFGLIAGHLSTPAAASMPGRSQNPPYEAVLHPSSSFPVSQPHLANRGAFSGMPAQPIANLPPQATRNAHSSGSYSSMSQPSNQPRPGFSGAYNNPPAPPSVIEIEDDARGETEDFTDEELVSLLLNFKTLSHEEQRDLINHIKEMEQRDPERIQRIKRCMKQP